MKLLGSLIKDGSVVVREDLILHFNTQIGMVTFWREYKLDKPGSNLGSAYNWLSNNW